VTVERRTRQKVERVLDEATELANDGADVYAAAESALTAQTTDVLRALAVAQIVDIIRARQRAVVAKVERRSTNARATTEEVEQRRSERLSGMIRALMPAVDRYVDEMKVQWTSELLDSEIALRDGTKVRYGSATRDQLTERAGILRTNMLANAEALALTERALRDLSESGARSLDELAGVAA
jgi:hypothetical protein